MRYLTASQIHDPAIGVTQRRSTLLLHWLPSSRRSSGSVSAISASETSTSPPAPFTLCLIELSWTWGRNCTSKVSQKKIFTGLLVSVGLNILNKWVKRRYLCCVSIVLRSIEISMRTNLLHLISSHTKYASIPVKVYQYTNKTMVFYEFYLAPKSLVLAKVFTSKKIPKNFKETLFWL